MGLKNQTRYSTCNPIKIMHANRVFCKLLGLEYDKLPLVSVLFLWDFYYYYCMVCHSIQSFQISLLQFQTDLRASVIEISSSGAICVFSYEDLPSAPPDHQQWVFPEKIVLLMGSSSPLDPPARKLLPIPSYLHLRPALSEYQLVQQVSMLL